MIYIYLYRKKELSKAGKLTDNWRGVSPFIKAKSVFIYSQRTAPRANLNFMMKWVFSCGLHRGDNADDIH